MKTQITWPSEVEAGFGAQQMVSDEHAEAGLDDDEHFEGEVGVGVGGWAFVDSLAILSRKLNTHYRTTPLLDSSRLDFDNDFSGPFGRFNDDYFYNFPRLERSSPGTFTLVINSHCPDSTFIFPIAAEAFLVTKNYQKYSTIDDIPYAVRW